MNENNLLNKTGAAGFGYVVTLSGRKGKANVVALLNILILSKYWPNIYSKLFLYSPGIHTILSVDSSSGGT